MKRILLVSAIAIAMAIGVGAGSPATAATGLTGNYVEARSCDVYTGPCFANGEVGITGGEAILTWSVETGALDGVALDGLTVVAVVAANNTLGDPYAKGTTSKSVLIVDARATDEQRDALVAMAKKMGGDLVSNVVDVKSASITARIGDCAESGCSTIDVEGLARISTRCLKDGDQHCGGNEFTYYPPLTDVNDATPAFTNVASYNGDGLGITWTNIDRRSAFLGTFAI